MHFFEILCVILKIVMLSTDITFQQQFQVGALNSTSEIVSKHPEVVEVFRILDYHVMELSVGDALS